jgi:hypothetical protein
MAGGASADLVGGIRWYLGRRLYATPLIDFYIVNSFGLPIRFS